jgi:hypothetical protein
MQNQYMVFNITYFFHTCVHCHILRLKNKTDEKNHFQYKYTFSIRTTYVEFQACTKIIPQGNLTSDCEIKQHM